MRKIIAWLIDKFSLHCPDCGGRLKEDFSDMKFDRTVYKCTDCGKRWL